MEQDLFTFWSTWDQSRFWLGSWIWVFSFLYCVFKHIVINGCYWEDHGSFLNTNYKISCMVRVIIGRFYSLKFTTLSWRLLHKDVNQNTKYTADFVRLVKFLWRMLFGRFISCLIKKIFWYNVNLKKSHSREN